MMPSATEGGMNFGFECTVCKRSLLSESRIILCPKGKQHCAKCWGKRTKENSGKLLKKFPPGTKVAWVNTEGAEVHRRAGVVITCSENRVRVKTKGERETWISPESIVAFNEENDANRL